MKNFRRVCAALMGVAALGMGAAGAVSAADIEPASPELRASFVPAPSCIHVKTWSSFWDKHARATNRCGETVRIKIIWAFAPDSECRSLGDGESFEHKRSKVLYPARFDGVALC